MKLHKLSAGLLILLMTASTGCNDFFDVNVDPLNPTKAEVSQLLPVTQVAMATYLGFNVNGLSQPTSALMQQLSNGRGIGTFQLAGDAFGNPWSGLYSDMLINNEQIITQGTTEQNWTYVGIAQVQKAFVISQMVDVWGDIPYTEALQGRENRAPRFDKDSDIYTDLFRLLDEAQVNLAKGSVRTPGSDDLIYKGATSNWIHLARTLKLKLLNQVRLTRDVSAEVQPLLADQANLLQSAEDFELPYGTSISPDNRNLGFIGDYVNDSRENYIGPFFFRLMLGRNDPRIAYYFFNQAASSVATADYQVNYQNPGGPTGARYFVSLRFGSVGANAATANSGARTLPGLYPVGGRFDDGRGGLAGPLNSNGRVSGNGSVAQRFFTFFNRKFTEAELQLTVLRNATAARTAFNEALLASFAKLNTIASANGVASVTGTTYITAALARYDAAATDAAKLNVIMTEKYVSSFGSGVDIYTDFRRTGYPFIEVPDGNNDSDPSTIDDNDGQTTSQGAFPRRLTYSQSDLQINPNAPQQPNVVTTRIFWDRRN